MKGKGIFRIMAVALTLFLLILAIPATPALAAYGYISISPISGPPGTWVTLYGSNFTPSTSTSTVTYTVWWSSTTALTTGTVSTSGTISTYFTVPSYTYTYTYGYTRGSYAITVTTNATDTTPTPAYFTIIPQVTLSSTSGYVGDQVTVYGSGFYAGSSVTIYFDSTAVATTTATSSGTLTSVVFTVPASYRGTHTVKGTDAIGDSSTTSYTTMQKVTITPALAAVGDKITISGTGFAASQSVTIYFDDESAGSATTDSVGTVSQTSFTVPASAWGSHTIRIQDASGNYAVASFSTKQSTTLAPTSGPIGTKVTLSGKGFNASAGISITIDDVPITTTVTTDTKGSFSTILDIPTSSGGAHLIKATDGTNTDTKTFTITATTSVSPTSGYVGTKVTVNGSGFLAGVSVSISFNNVPVKTVSTDAKGSFSTNFDVPAQGAGTYKIRASDGANVKDTDFTVLTTATISPVTSTTSPGYVGTLVTVNGIGFMPGRTVTITYDGKQVATTAVASDGGFSVTFNAPASSSGAHTVNANDGTNSIPLTFVMEATPPPVPAPSKPESGTKAKSLATFDWSTVSDPSGVTYRLQIATDAGFTQIVLDKKELTQSEYTLTKDEKLSSVSKNTPYYWRVKAADAASNESAWSSAGSFYVGFTFTTQTLIYIIIGIAAVILILLAFWVGTRRTARSE